MDEKTKRIIEAVLFMSGRQVGIRELKRITGIASSGYIKMAVSELEKEYSSRGSAIEITREGESFQMTIRDEYLEYAREFAQESELTKGAMKVLAFIYREKGRVLQSEMAKRLGSWIYSAVSELKEKGFVSLKRAGRSKHIMLTDKFSRYFKVGK